MTVDCDWASALIGQRLLEIEKDSDNLKIITDIGAYFCYAEGDCCAHAYVESIEFPDFCKGAKIIGGVHKSSRTEEWKYGDVIDYDFYQITTEKGYVDIELRTKHNGYYSGWLHEPKMILNPKIEEPDPSISPNSK